MVNMPRAFYRMGENTINNEHIFNHKKVYMYGVILFLAFFDFKQSNECMYCKKSYQKSKLSELFFNV